MMQFGKQRPGSRDDEPNTVRRILRLCAGRRLQFSALHCRWPSPRPSPRRWWWTSSPAGIADVGERAAATGPGDATLRERMVVCCLRRSRHVPPFEPRRSTAVPVGCRLILRGSISRSQCGRRRRTSRGGWRREAFSTARGSARASRSGRNVTDGRTPGTAERLKDAREGVHVSTNVKRYVIDVLYREPTPIRCFLGGKLRT